MKRSTHSASYEYRYGGMLYEVLTDFPGEGDIRFQYRGDRKRHSSSAPGLPGARMDWDAGWNMVSWRAESGGAVLNEMIANPYSVVNAPAYDKHGGIHFSDQIGTTRALMTEPGSLARARDYAPYGEALADSGGSSDSFYRFGGKIHHPNIGKSYFPYRYYSPAQARWTTRDPLGMVDGPNVYQYVSSRPTSLVDPLGLWGACWGKKVPCVKVWCVEWDDCGRCVRTDYKSGCCDPPDETPHPCDIQYHSVDICYACCETKNLDYEGLRDCFLDCQANAEKPI